MKYPFIVSVPHCGEAIPPEIKPRVALSPVQVRESVDHGTAEIFAALPAATVINARYSRLICDLNRSPNDTGPKGIVAKTDYHGREIFKPGMYPDEHTRLRWVRAYFRPYHEALAKAVREDQAIGLFDSHSLNGTGPADAPDAGQKRHDIILSNNGGPTGERVATLGETTCPASIVRLVKSAFEQAGFSTALNTPYTGGFITRHYGTKFIQKGGFALQIEINQDLYLDDQKGLCDPERTREAAEKVRSVFETICRRLAEK